ncbi:MAG: hypothetical protein JXA92_04420 [candidate division Zixibacteria bacterium]|nr:hypothetical protein [candidate division Zixibacteria bacterium]
MCKITITLLIGLTVVILSFNHSQADITDAAVTFLKISNSPRANGMGGCIINLVDEQAALYNPGALALFHRDKFVSVNFPNNTGWLPELSDDTKLRSWGVSAGISRSNLRPDDTPFYNAFMAVAFSSLKLKQGELVGISGSYYPEDEADVFTAALGFELRNIIRLGFGFSHKAIKSRLAEGLAGKAELTARDYGLIAQMPLSDLVPHKIYLENSDDYYINFKLIPSFACVWANYSDKDVCYGTSTDCDPLPKTIRRGGSVYFGINVNNSSLFSVLLAGETDKSIFDDDVKNYHNGIEFGLFETFYYRSGHGIDRFGGMEFDSYGLGFSLHGVISWLNTLNKLKMENEILNKIFNNMNLTYNFARYDGGALTNTNFFKLSLSF